MQSKAKEAEPPLSRLPLDNAFELLRSPLLERQIARATQAMIALNLAREAGVTRIVYLSVIHSDPYVNLPHFAGTIAPSALAKSSETPLSSSTTSKWPERVGAGRPSISVRKTGELRLVRQPDGRMIDLRGPAFTSINLRQSVS
jgi:uncharacterized protein YbjT (DUF2867 family)